MEQKIRDLRAKGLSLNEIAERLKIKRKDVEIALTAKTFAVTLPPVPAAKPTSVKKATPKKQTKKGK